MKLDIITGSRAEYGIMRNLISTIQSDEYFDLRVIVTGMHLEEKYGNTINDIKKDGIKISHQINSEMYSTTEEGTLHSINKTFEGFSKYYINEKPDAVLVLGDRYEILAAVNVCAFLKIPVIHLHGGEKTEGNYDEFIRHNITKMSKLHFVAANEFRNRVIQLGENPKSVYNVGALGVENIKQSSFYSVKEINEELKTEIKEKEYFLIAFHPETLNTNDKGNEELLRLLKKYKEEYNFIFIGANSDTGSDEIMKNIEEFLAEDEINGKVFTSVSSKMYYSLVKNAKLLIGNSSSGLIEAPSLGTITINIGDRQKGRLSGNSVIHCKNELQEIEEAIKEGIGFKVDKINNPYEKEGTCKNIIEIIKESNMMIKAEQKLFYDIENMEVT